MEKYGFTGEDLAKDITELEDVLRTVSSGRTGTVLRHLCITRDSF